MSQIAALEGAVLIEFFKMIKFEQIRCHTGAGTKMHKCLVGICYLELLLIIKDKFISLRCKKCINLKIYLVSVTGYRKFRDKRYLSFKKIKLGDQLI